MPIPSSKPIALDLFCGSGAVSLGLQQAGFEVIGAVDLDSGACKTYRANHDSVRLLEQDIREVDPKDFSDLIPQKLDLLAVCAPCQPFSNQNRHRSKNDTRRNLVDESKKFIDEFSPTLVFLENVPGLASSDIFDDFKEWLEKAGYSVSSPLKVDAADLGVPQRRSRMVLIAAKGVSLDTAMEINKVHRKTVRDALNGLEQKPPVGRAAAIKDPLHFARRHTPLNIARLEEISRDGGSRDELPPHLQLECHKGRKKSSFSDTYGRMKWDDIAPTLTTGCTDITRGRYAHPEENRAITLREAARLQTFPDEYIFWGNASQVATQIGNAVPPSMMKAIALSLKSALHSSL